MRLLLFAVLLLLTHTSQQQNTSRNKPSAKKDSDARASAALEELQQRINDIVQELNLVKEQQALQTEDTWPPHAAFDDYSSLCFPWTTVRVCLRGIKIPGKCFLVDTVKKRYHTANEDCIAKGGILSTPVSSDENKLLHDYVRQSIGPDAVIWLGVNDMQIEGVWMDQTGSNIRYQNWKLPQPDGGLAENCAVLSGEKWLDERCREERASVCEFNIV